MKIKLEINGREYEFSAPLPDDDVRDELEKERYSYQNLAQRYNDRELVVKAQDKRIKELEEQIKKMQECPIGGVFIEEAQYEALTGLCQAAEAWRKGFGTSDELCTAIRKATEVCK